MAALGLALVIAAGGVGTLVWLWRADRGGGLFILAAMPFALLLPAAGTAAAAWTLIQGFQRIAQSGSSGVGSVAAFSADSTRVMLLGVVACAMVVIFSAILQGLAGNADDSLAPPPAGRRATAAPWLLVLAGCPLLALASAGLVVRLRPLPVIIVRLAEGMGDGRSPLQTDAVAEVATRLGTDATPGALSAVLSNLLVQVSLLSLALGALLVVVGIIGIVAFTSTSKPRWVGVWSWIALVAVLAGSAAVGVALASDLRFIELAGR